MPHLPNLRHLRYLAALADHGHFGRAAAACFVTQSTLSAGIRELESAMGVQVAERTRHSVRMTPIGHRIVARARLLLREAEALMALGAEQARPMSGRLELGVLPTIGPYLLPKLIRALGERFPQLKLGLREDRTGNLLRLLAEGRLDLVLMAFPYNTPGMERMLLFDDAYRYVTATDSPQAAATPASLRPVSEADFEGESLLLLEHEHCLHSHALPTLQRIGELAQASYGHGRRGAGVDPAARPRHHRRHPARAWRGRAAPGWRQRPQHRLVLAPRFGAGRQLPVARRVPGGLGANPRTCLATRPAHRRTAASLSRPPGS